MNAAARTLETASQIDALLEGKRLTHPELREPLTWEGLRQVWAREGVLIVSGELPADAVLLSALGTAVIVLNCALHPQRRAARGAHELGHWWLHRANTRVRHPLAHDEREDQAEYVARRLIQGLRPARGGRCIFHE